MPVLNDSHARISSTTVAEAARPHTAEEAAELVRLAAVQGRTISASGARHAMGRQAFATDSLHIDTRGLAGVDRIDHHTGLATIGAGSTWTRLIPELLGRQLIERPYREPRFGIRQKQTGAKDLSIGGAVAANIHGRGLALAPFVDDIESIEIVTPRGELVSASRTERPDLFAQAVGGYGLFGLVTSATLRLSRRQKVRRLVDAASQDEVIDRLHERRDSGSLYGDFQFAIDHASDAFLRDGILVCYEPVRDDTPIPEDQRYFSEPVWLDLVRKARADKTRAFEDYLAYYRSTHGQIYHSDTHQLSTYVPGYHDAINASLPPELRGTEVISELYVPRPKLAEFLEQAAETLRSARASVTYGTVRLIEPDTTTALPWARQPWACVIFNLLTDPADTRPVAAAKRALIELALSFGGTYYLTYHRFAAADQLLRAHPAIGAFMDARDRHDPDHLFDSDWSRGICEQLGR
jgi:FAD/FMN-containing dehydrogenase